MIFRAVCDGQLQAAQFQSIPHVVDSAGVAER